MKEEAPKQDEHTDLDAVPSMTIDRDAPIVVAAELSVFASPESVWRLLSDVANWPTWHPGIRSVTTDGPAAVDRWFVWRPGRSTLTSVVREVQPSTRIGWTGSTLGLKARHVWNVSGDGTQSRVQTEESMDGLLSRLFRRQLQQRVQRDLDDWLAHLKAAAET